MAQRTNPLAREGASFEGGALLPTWAGVCKDLDDDRGVWS
jgi:hypothetical protein